jgi:hypothetical protein
MTRRFGGGVLLGWLAALVSIAAVAVSIWLHPPSEMRARRLDEIRMQSLKETEGAIWFYYIAHHSLPVDLSVLKNEENHQVVRWHDPETNRPFEYAVTGDATYQLCATFARSSDQGDALQAINGTHNRGRDGFQMKADRGQGRP